MTHSITLNDQGIVYVIYSFEVESFIICCKYLLLWNYLLNHFSKTPFGLKVIDFSGPLLHWSSPDIQTSALMSFIFVIFIIIILHNPNYHYPVSGGNINHVEHNGNYSTQNSVTKACQGATYIFSFLTTISIAFTSLAGSTIIFCRSVTNR